MAAEPVEIRPERAKTGSPGWGNLIASPSDQHEPRTIRQIQDDITSCRVLALISRVGKAKDNSVSLCHTRGSLRASCPNWNPPGAHFASRLTSSSARLSAGPLNFVTSGHARLRAVDSALCRFRQWVGFPVVIQFIHPKKFVHPQEPTSPMGS